MSGKDWKEQLLKIRPLFEKRDEAAMQPVARDPSARSPSPLAGHGLDQLDYSSPYRKAQPRNLASSNLENVTREQQAAARDRGREAIARYLKWKARVRHRQLIGSVGLPYAGSSVQRRELERQSVCFRCHSRVDSSIHAICASCRWLDIICPTCGACGCVYDDGERFAAGGEERLDDVDQWLVREGGRYVFPEVSEADAADAPPAVARRESYQLYLRTTAWREKRIGALKNAFHRCERCGADESLQVHHKTYDRVGGDELPGDLEVLCERCHYAHHHWAGTYLRFLNRSA